jgi:hypothetical protein
MRVMGLVAARLVWLGCVGLSACAMQPLSTPEAVPRSSCPSEVQRVRLFGFQEKDPELAERVATLFGGAATVEHLRLEAFFDADGSSRSDLDVALLDAYRNVKSNATARRLTNMYFTFTVIDIWILPILHATDLFESSAELSAEIGLRDASSGTTTRRISPRAALREKPTGYFGPSDGDFTLAMVERATSNLAVVIYEDACNGIRQATQPRTE